MFRDPNEARQVKASVVTAYGGPEVMKYQDMPDPEPGAGDVLVKVAGIGINPEDMLERNGDLKDRWPLHFPAIIGLDVSGTVVATGDGVTDLKVGDRVCGWSYHTYAELVADKATSLRQGAGDDGPGRRGRDSARGRHGQPIDLRRKRVAVWPNGAGLRRGGRRRSFAVYMAKVSGAHVIAGVQRFQLDQADSIGADETIALDDPAAFATIPQVDIVANMLRGKAATDLLAKVKDGGTFASVTGEPDGAKDYPKVRVVPFRSTARPRGHRLHRRRRKRRQDDDPDRPPRGAQERGRRAGRVHEGRYR